jgi:hypothetical protein
MTHFTGTYHDDGSTDCTAEPPVSGCMTEDDGPCYACSTPVRTHADEDGTYRLVELLNMTDGKLAVAMDAYLSGIERGFAHWEFDHPDTGEHLSGDPAVVILGRDQWLAETQKLRALVDAAMPPKAEVGE